MDSIATRTAIVLGALIHIIAPQTPKRESTTDTGLQPKKLVSIAVQQAMTAQASRALTRYRNPQREMANTQKRESLAHRIVPVDTPAQTHMPTLKE